MGRFIPRLFLFIFLLANANAIASVRPVTDDDALAFESMGLTTPQIPSSNFTITRSACNQVSLSWTSGDGYARVVIARKAAPVNSFPRNNVVYAASETFGQGAQIGTGNYVVYNGSGDMAIVSGLLQETEYYFVIIEYNKEKNDYKYNVNNYASASHYLTGFVISLSSSPQMICSGEQTSLTASGGVAYSWEPAASLSASNGTEVVASPTQTTVYTVSGTDAYGCNASENIAVYVNHSPDVIFDQQLAVCFGSSPIALTSAYPDGGVYSGPGVGNNTFFPDQVTGQNVITYRYTDLNGCTGEDTATFYVSPYPVISFSPIDDICFNSQPLLLTLASPAGGNYSGSGVNGNHFDPSAVGIGTSSISYTYTNETGCSTTDSTVIKVRSLPVVSAGSLASVCESNPSYELTVGTPQGGYFSGAGVNDDNRFDPSVAGTGTHTLIYSFTDQYGCTNTATTTVKVKPLVASTFTQPDPVCISHPSFPMTGGSPAGGFYSGPGMMNNTFYPSTSGAGNFTITYSYQDANSCALDVTQTMTVYNNPGVSLALPQAICGNADPLTLVGGNPIGGTYEGLLVADGKFDPTGASPGDYQVTYSYTDNHQCTGKTSKTITVLDYPSLQLGNDTTICTSQSLTLDAGPGFDTYHWSNGSTSQSITVQNSSATTISCVATVANSYNCSASDTMKVTFDICSGLPIVKSDYPWSYIFPNPFTRTFKILSEKRLEMRIFDISGRLVEEGFCEGTYETGENLRPGIYFVDVSYNGKNKTHRVVKSE